MRIWLIAGFSFVLAAAAAAYAGFPETRTAGVFPTDPATPYFRYTPVGPERGRILAVHGLGSSKEIMSILCYGLAEAGFEVYAIDLPGHGASTAQFDAESARNAVAAAVEFLGQDAILLGHSFGSALLLDLARRRPAGAMVLLSPPPTPIDDVRIARALVVTGRFDIPRVRAFGALLERTVAIEARTEPWATHTSLVRRSGAIGGIAEWLGGDASGIRAGRRMALLSCILAAGAALGLTLLWPGNAMHGRRAAAQGRKEQEPAAAAPPVWPTVRRYVWAGAAAFVVAGLVPIAGWIRLYGADHLAGFLLAAGLALYAHGPRSRIDLQGIGGAAAAEPQAGAIPAAPRIDLRVIGIAAAAAAGVIALLAVVAGAELAHLTLSGGRWWRFPAIAALSLPLFAADESLLRPLRPWWKAAAAAAITRVVLGALVVSSALILNQSAAFLVLAAHLVVLFWMALWLAGEAVRRRTRNPLATALFAALVQGWAFAAIFAMV